MAAFKRGELDRDFVAVVRFQGPKANGMPELHNLTPPLGVLLDRGFKVALVTDGRMSGASGKVPAAIHVTPEAADGGPLAHVRDGDIIRLDAERRHAGGPGGRGRTRRPRAGQADLSEQRIRHAAPRHEPERADPRGQAADDHPGPGRGPDRDDHLVRPGDRAVHP